METNGEDHKSNSSEDEEEEKPEEEPDSPPRMFKFEIVNSYGTSEVQKISDDGKPIKFNSRFLNLKP